VIEDTASRRGAALIEVSRDYRYQALSHSLDGQNFLVWRADEQSQMDAYREHYPRSGWEPVRLSLPLLGKHQIDNAVTAYAALQAARQAGLRISTEAIQKGFAGVEWPGRFEVMNRDPLLIVDSAHNPDSAAKLRQALDDYLPGMPVILLFGASEDKDVWGMFQELIPRVERVIATQSVHPRAMEAEKIVELAQRLGCPAKAVLPFEAALQTALSEAGGRSAVIAAGSLFIAAAARHAWLIQAEQHRSS
ncbi:MAG TPA: cyanophycin synthetase, partial [Anaerolineaceae bacterium]|nr:cyanophycin synthetase [Anaerolineaceae bacterium]